ncbi:MAG: hypothetical protein V8Q79_02865 [Christensenellales bacterium]
MTIYVEIGVHGRAADTWSIALERGQARRQVNRRQIAVIRKTEINASAG